MKAEGLLAPGTKLRSSKYLNNLIEQDHCGLKLRIGPMLGFKRFRTAAITIAGIERGGSRKANSTSGDDAFIPAMCMPSGTLHWRRNKLQMAEQYLLVSS